MMDINTTLRKPMSCKVVESRAERDSQQLCIDLSTNRCITIKSNFNLSK